VRGNRATARPSAASSAANKRDEFASFHWITSRQASTPLSGLLPRADPGETNGAGGGAERGRSAHAGAWAGFRQLLPRQQSRE
jgi:hypothetical protein